jgi:hypothetical protein
MYLHKQPDIAARQIDRQAGRQSGSRHVPCNPTGQRKEISSRKLIASIKGSNASKQAKQAHMEEPAIIQQLLQPLARGGTERRRNIANRLPDSRQNRLCQVLLLTVCSFSWPQPEEIRVEKKR